MLRKKFIAVATSAALAVSLCPGLAVASTVTAGSVDDNAAAKTVSTQKKVSVKVLKGYDYNSKGLLTKYNDYKLKYSGNNIKYIGVVGNGYSDKYSVKSSNGLVKTATEVSKSGKYKEKTKYSFTYNAAGNVTGYTTTSWSNCPYGKYLKKNKLEKYRNTSTAYKLNSDGTVASAVTKTAWTDKSASVTSEEKFYYDKAGNLIATKNGKFPRFRYRNSYDTWTSGETRITRQIKKKWSAEIEGYQKYSDRTFEYTTIKVPKSAVKIVKAQQWALINDNVNKAFGPLF